MAAAIIRRFFGGRSAVVLLLFLLLGSLYLMASATENSEQFGKIYIPLLAINAIELLILAGLITYNLGRLIRQYRNQATGSRLTVRLVVLFVVLAVTPVSVLYYFSLGFIRHGIDSWFDVRIEQAMDGALELSRTTLDWRMRDMMRQAEFMAESVSEVEPDELLLSLNDLRHEMGAVELSLLSRRGGVFGFSSDEPGQFSPTAVDGIILSQLENGLAYVGLDPGPQPNTLYARLIVNVPASVASVEPRVLQALFPVPKGIDKMISDVQSAYSQHEQLKFLSGPLKFSFTLTLSLVLLLSIFTSIWAALFLARRLVAPIRVLAIGTRAVASGDYYRQLPTTVDSGDELGFLVKSFNTMMARIAGAREEAELSRQSLEEQKGYLETVLGHLSSGVMTFDHKGGLLTANSAAEQIFGIELVDCLGVALEDIAAIHEHLKPFAELTQLQIGREQPDWQEQAVLNGEGGRQVLMCRGVHLPSQTEQDTGYVVLFDDITALLQAQRDAAWGEVARRIAHEIKNPLTPIRLSAERLRHKYLPSMSEEDGRLLDRSTHTIVQQVENMKEMVKAFSDYARTPKLELNKVDINGLINDVLEMYGSGGRSLAIDVSLDPRIESVDADSGRMRQLIHNLIKNAIEASESEEITRIYVATQLQGSDEQRRIELSVADSGPGIPDNMVDKVFEPYISSKPKGGGLGLAIVKKIVEEHNGSIWAENVAAGGACFNVRLPVEQAMDADDSGNIKQGNEEKV
ncbi:PAS domain-containing sensor histidine kinase [Pseudomonadota bacterium]